MEFHDALSLPISMTITLKKYWRNWKEHWHQRVSSVERKWNWFHLYLYCFIWSVLRSLIKDIWLHFHILRIPRYDAAFLIWSCQFFFPPVLIQLLFLCPEVKASAPTWVKWHNRVCDVHNMPPRCPFQTYFHPKWHLFYLQLGRCLVWMQFWNFSSDVMKVLYHFLQPVSWIRDKGVRWTGIPFRVDSVSCPVFLG